MQARCAPSDTVFAMFLSWWLTIKRALGKKPFSQRWDALDRHKCFVCDSDSSLLGLVTWSSRCLIFGPGCLPVPSNQIYQCLIYRNLAVYYTVCHKIIFCHLRFITGDPTLRKVACTLRHFYLDRAILQCMGILCGLLRALRVYYIVWWDPIF